MSKLKIGVFGAHRGITMMKVLLKHPEAELAAVCDRYVPALKDVQKLAEENGQKVALYESFDDFIHHPMDAMVLANYATEHAPYAVRALRAGIHVMSELMPCETIAQGIELIEAVEETGLVYTFAENVCYADGPFELWRRYEKGDIGEMLYGEGEYIHDGSSIRPQITYGDPNHWRFRLHPFFYCTHSLGTLMAMNKARAVKVSGFGTPPQLKPYLHGLGEKIGAIEMVTLESGAILKSMHGGMIREPAGYDHLIYGTSGNMRCKGLSGTVEVYRAGNAACKGTQEVYEPKKVLSPDLAEKFASHGGADFYATHFFIESIWNRPDGKQYAIDVYRSVEMGLCGLLAYRSQLAGGIPIDIPDFRDSSQRDAWRNDCACTCPGVAGDQLLPQFMGAEAFPPIPQSAYDKLQKLWQSGEPYTTDD